MAAAGRIDSTHEADEPVIADAFGDLLRAAAAGRDAMGEIERDDGVRWVRQVALEGCPGSGSDSTQSLLLGCGELRSRTTCSQLTAGR